MRRLVLLGHVELPVALEFLTRGERLPDHVKSVQAEGIRQVKLIDASPIGINIRSTVATYANIHDELRKVFARTPGAREYGCKAGDLMAQAASALTSSSFRTWTSPVRTATVPGMPGRRSTSAGRVSPCPA